MSWFFPSGGQSIGASASLSVPPMNIQGWFPLWLIDLLAAQGTLKSLQYHNSKASVFQHSAFFMAQLSHLYMTTGKTIALTIQTFVGKVISLLFNMLSRFVMVFLPRRKIQYKRVWNAALGCNLKNNRMISVRFQGKSFNITVIQVYAPATNAKEAEAKQFNADLQDLLELTPKWDVLFILEDWNTKVGSQEIFGVTGKFVLWAQNEWGKS